MKRPALSVFILSCLGLVFLSEGQNVTQLIAAAGYPCEDYYVQTSDGFLLNVQRIPHGRNGMWKGASSKPVVYLQHGLIDNSNTWVNNLYYQSLGFILADAGYDVFLGNVRGNGYSAQNVNYNQDDTRLWNLVDFDNMIAIDLPTMVNFALKISGASSLSYIGHSQGTLMGFGAFSNDTTGIADKVDIFIALAPVATVGHQESLLLTFLADIDVAQILDFFGEKEFLPSNAIIEEIGGLFCKIDPTLCSSIIFLLAGSDTTNLNTTRLPVYIHDDGGTSVRNMIHWSQAVTSGKFQQFDYGKSQNQVIYGQSTPPVYNLGALNKPKIALFSGANDVLADPADVQLLVNALPITNAPVLWHLEPTYNHMDFVWGENAYQKIYPLVLDLLQKHGKNQKI